MSSMKYVYCEFMLLCLLKCGHLQITMLYSFKTLLSVLSFTNRTLKKDFFLKLHIKMPVIRLVIHIQLIRHMEEVTDFTEGIN